MQCFNPCGAASVYMRQPPAAFHLAAALSPHVTFNVTYYVAALVEVALCTWYAFLFSR
ncbi:hypothetical protein J6590_025640 [Homalodisca vitripennis]|nr:hypothetical protein J6590_025640 [Homalodisca vitripennis]